MNKPIKTTQTVHLLHTSHAIANIYRGYVLETENRQLSPARALDELVMLGAATKLPSEFLSAFGALSTPPVQRKRAAKQSLASPHA